MVLPGFSDIWEIWLNYWCWEGLGAGGEGDDRGWDGWMASPTPWTCVWVNSRNCWWTGRPGVLWFMRSQRVRHDWATEWTDWTVLSLPPTQLVNSLMSKGLSILFTAAECLLQEWCDGVVNKLYFSCFTDGHQLYNGQHLGSIYESEKSLQNLCPCGFNIKNQII